MPPSSTGGAAGARRRGTPAEGFFATWRRLSLGLWLAPVGIAALVGVLYVYYQNLDLANAVRQTRSALQWDTKLWPQLVQHIQISFSATAIVIAIAVPLGIVLTRPAFRRVGPYIVAVANSGQALPAYGLLVLVAAGLGHERQGGGLGASSSTPCCRCCATRWSASTTSTAPSSRRAAGWA